jgi:hypothetical protein
MHEFDNVEMDPLAAVPTGAQLNAGSVDWQKPEDGAWSVVRLHVWNETSTPPAPTGASCNDRFAAVSALLPLRNGKAATWSQRRGLPPGGHERVTAPPVLPGPPKRILKSNFGTKMLSEMRHLGRCRPWVRAGAEASVATTRATSRSKCSVDALGGPGLVPTREPLAGRGDKGSRSGTSRDEPPRFTRPEG